MRIAIVIFLSFASVSPAQTNLAVVVGNRSQTNYFTVQNVGQGTLIGAGAVNGPFYFSSVPTYSLSSGAAQQFGIYFQPAAGGFNTNIVSWTGGAGAQTTVEAIGCVGLPLNGFASTAGTVRGFTNGTGVIAQPVEVPDAQSGGRAYYCFYITNAGNYYISNTVHAPDGGANSAYLRIDGEPFEPYWVWNAPVTAATTNVAIAIRGLATGATNQFDPYVATLTAGWHQIIVAGREAGMEIGQFTVTAQAVSVGPIVSVPQNFRLLTQ